MRRDNNRPCLKQVIAKKTKNKAAITIRSLRDTPMNSGNYIQVAPPVTAPSWRLKSQRELLTQFRNRRFKLVVLQMGVDYDFVSLRILVFIRFHV
jgi:hypothetical protein